MWQAFSRVAILVAGIAVCGAASAQTIAGCEGEDVYRNTFDSAEAAGVTPDEARNVVDGRLRLTSQRAGEVSVLVPLPTSLAIEICVDMVFVDGPEPTGSSASLAIFGGSVWAELTVFPDGRATISRRTGEVSTVLVPERPFPAIRTGAGAFNQLKIVVIQNDATYFVNGEPFASLVGPMTPYSPSVALRANSPADGSATFAFDDLTITKSPLATIPGPMLREQLAAAAAEARPAAENECEGPLIHEERFTSIAREWLDQNEVDPTISHGRLWLSAATDGKDAIAGRSVAFGRDFDACVTATLVDGPDGGTASAKFGLFDDSGSRVFWFSIHSDGTADGYRLEGGTETAIIPRQTVNALRLGRGAANALKISVWRGKATFFVNGEPLEAVGDDIRGDWVLFGARSPAEGVATYTFSDLLVARYEGIASAACDGTVVIEDRFDSLSALWQPADRFKVENGQLQVSLLGGSVATRAAVEGHDLKVCATATLLEIRGGDPSTLRSGLSVLDSAGAALGLWVAADGKIKILDEVGKEVANAEVAAGREDSNDLRIEIAGPRVTFFVNELRVATTDRELVLPLSIGLGVYAAYAGWTSTWAFDDVKVARLGEAPPAGDLACGGDVLLEDKFDTLSPVWGDPSLGFKVEEGRLLLLEDDPMPLVTDFLWTETAPLGGHDVDICVTAVWTGTSAIDAEWTTAGLHIAGPSNTSIQFDFELETPGIRLAGQPNELRVQIAGGEARFFINGAEVATRDDVPDGPLAIAFNGTIDSFLVDGTWAFDDLKVTTRVPP